MNNQPIAKSQNNGHLQWWKICGGFLLAGVLTIVVSIALVLRATSGAVTASNEFFAQLSVGEYSAAYDETSYAFQAETNIESFYDYVENYPEITEVTDTNYTTRQVENTNLGSFTTLGGDLITVSGESVPVTIVYIQEYGDWKMYGFEIYPIAYE